MIDVNRLRRRPDGERVLVYLDQSALSGFAREDRHRDALRVLKQLIESGVVICLRSHEHEDETLLAPRELWDRIDNLSDELATGIEFKASKEIEWAEIYSAATLFLGLEAPSAPPWQEAFTADPQTPRDDLFFSFFGGSIRVRARFDPSDWQIAEVEHEKAKELQMSEAYQALRTAGYSYEDMAEANIRETLRWKLPLADPDHFRAELAKRYASWTSECARDGINIDAGSAYSRMMAFAERNTKTRYLLERYPALADRGTDFAYSDELRHMPMLTYPSLFRAALAATPGRKARESDGYDIAHLTLGLSRCDFVTADSGMTQLCRDFQLVPDECQLFSYRELDAMIEALREQCA